jgi:protein-tyrosine phosphatase
VFDLVVAMDRTNLADLRELARTPEHLDKIVLLRAFDPSSPRHDADALDVPDPYYGGHDGFAEVFDLIDAACRGLLDHVQTHHLGRGREPR